MIFILGITLWALALQARVIFDASTTIARINAAVASLLFVLAAALLAIGLRRLLRPAGLPASDHS
jgi:hypothetical protein